MKKYYVYEYRDPRSNITFYVGKGTGNRYKCHLYETKDNTENKKKYAVIQGLRNKGLEPTIEIVMYFDCEIDAYEYEENLIEKYGRRDIDENGILTNICADNRPPVTVLSDEQREKLVERMTGNTYRKGVPSPFKGKERIELQGENNGFYGRKHSEETRRVMSEKAKARPSNRLGYKQSEETKKKIQSNNPNRKDIHTPDGVYMSAEEYATSTGKITPNGLRNLLKVVDMPLSQRRTERCPLLTLNDIGRTPREMGYYYI